MSNCPYNNCKCRIMCFCIPAVEIQKIVNRISYLAIIKGIPYAGRKFMDVVNDLINLNSEYVSNQLLEIGIEKGKHYTITPDACITEIVEDSDD